MITGTGDHDPPESGGFCEVAGTDGTSRALERDLIEAVLN